MGLVIYKGLTLRKGFQPESYMYEFPNQYPVWSPAEISTALWLDAADSSTITESGGAVSQWNDKSGNNRHATQATSGNRPTVGTTVLGGLRTVSFNGTTQWIQTGAYTGSQPLTMFCIAQTNVTTGPGAFRQYVFDTANFVLGSANRQLLALRGNQTNTIAIFAGSSFGNSGVATTASPRIVGSHFSGESSFLAIDGTFYSLSSNPGIADNTFGHVIGGGNLGTNDMLDGYVAEFVVVLGAANTDTRQRIEGYLAHKWGLTANLPNDHPYKTVGPTP
jgi:hypothetical protein